MKKYFGLIIISIAFLLSCSNANFKLARTKDSSMLYSEKDLPSPYLFAFPFNATTNVNDSLYFMFKRDRLKAEDYAKKYLPRGIEELRDKFGFYEWNPDSTKSNCISSQKLNNEHCKVDIKSTWSKPISPNNSTHFTEMIPKLDPDYKSTYVYRFQISVVIKVYVDKITQLVHYDAMLFLNIERKGSYENDKYYKPIKKLKNANGEATVLENSINKILYNYYLTWINDELGKKKK